MVVSTEVVVNSVSLYFRPYSHRHFDAQYCDIKYFKPWISKGQGKLLTKNKSRDINKTQIEVCFVKSLPWLVNINLCLKIIFILHIFLFRYCLPKCFVWIRPYMEIFLFTNFLAWSYLIHFFLLFSGKIRGILPYQPGVNFINIFTYEFFVRTSFWQLFLVTFWLWQKIRTKKARV